MRKSENYKAVEKWKDDILFVQSYVTDNNIRIDKVGFISKVRDRRYIDTV